jgi:hypothetical protein
MRDPYTTHVKRDGVILLTREMWSMIFLMTLTKDLACLQCKYHPTWRKSLSFESHGSGCTSRLKNKKTIQHSEHMYLTRLWLDDIYSSIPHWLSYPWFVHATLKCYMFLRDRESKFWFVNRDPWNGREWRMEINWFVTRLFYVNNFFKFE